MAEVSPISPLIHPKGRAALLKNILITSALTRRQPRAPDYASENCVLVALFQSHVAEVSRLNLDMELDEIAFDIDPAIPCGLILNELLTNALKYAFPNGRSGNIHMTLRAAAEQVTLSVHDTGIGFPEGFDFRNTESLGLQLVGMMTEQLGGMLTLTRGGGTTFTISIPYGTR